MSIATRLPQHVEDVGAYLPNEDEIARQTQGFRREASGDRKPFVEILEAELDGTVFVRDGMVGQRVVLRAGRIIPADELEEIIRLGFETKLARTTGTYRVIRRKRLGEHDHRDDYSR